MGGWYVDGQDPQFLGLADDVPLAGDYNGDGRTEIAVFRPATGTWYLQGGTAVSWGVSGDVPVGGTVVTTTGSAKSTASRDARRTLDFDGDSKSDLVVFRPATGGWFIRPSAPASYSYDANGNRTARTALGGATTEYRYDQANRLVDAGGTTSTYNGDGLRMTATSRGTSAFVWDISAAIPRVLTDGALTFVYGPDGLPVEQIDGAGNASYFVLDNNGSTRALLAGDGSVGATFTTSAYGLQTMATGSLRTPLLYGQSYSDAATGLLYLVNRYYDPTTAQFMTVDPVVGLTGSPYGYAAGDPINGRDPAGLLCLSPSGALRSGRSVGYAGSGGSSDLALNALFAAFSDLDDLHDIEQTAQIAGPIAVGIRALGGTGYQSVTGGLQIARAGTRNLGVFGWLSLGVGAAQTVRSGVQNGWGDAQTIGQGVETGGGAIFTVVGGAPGSLAWSAGYSIGTAIGNTGFWDRHVTTPLFNTGWFN